MSVLETEWLLSAGKTTKLYCVQAFWAAQTVQLDRFRVVCSCRRLCVHTTRSGVRTSLKKLEAGCVISPTLPDSVLRRSSAKDAGGAVDLLSHTLNETNLAFCRLSRTTSAMFFLVRVTRLTLAS
ncbi:unnamed protein product [Ixodes persulcatus]